MWPAAWLVSETPDAVPLGVITTVARFVVPVTPLPAKRREPALPVRVSP